MTTLFVFFLPHIQFQTIKQISKFNTKATTTNYGLKNQFKSYHMALFDPFTHLFQRKQNRTTYNMFSNQDPLNLNSISTEQGTNDELTYLL